MDFGRTLGCADLGTGLVWAMVSPPVESYSRRTANVFSAMTSSSRSAVSDPRRRAPEGTSARSSGATRYDVFSSSAGIIYPLKATSRESASWSRRSRKKPLPATPRSNSPRRQKGSTPAEPSPSPGGAQEFFLSPSPCRLQSRTEVLSGILPPLRRGLPGRVREVSSR